MYYLATVHHSSKITGCHRHAVLTYFGLARSSLTVPSCLRPSCPTVSSAAASSALFIPLHLIAALPFHTALTNLTAVYRTPS